MGDLPPEQPQLPNRVRKPRQSPNRARKQRQQAGTNKRYCEYCEEDITEHINNKERKEQKEQEAKPLDKEEILREFLAISDQGLSPLSPLSSAFRVEIARAGGTANMSKPRESDDMGLNAPFFVSSGQCWERKPPLTDEFLDDLLDGFSKQKTQIYKRGTGHFPCDSTPITQVVKQLWFPDPENHGRHGLTALSEDCVKLWALYPLSDHNKAELSEVYDKNSLFIALQGRLEKGEFCIQTAAEALYLPPGYIHATVTLRGGLTPGIQFTTPHCITLSEKMLILDNEKREITNEHCMPLLESILLGLRSHEGKHVKEAKAALCRCYMISGLVLPNSGNDFLLLVTTFATEPVKLNPDHILALRHAKLDPRPELYFEYVPGGTLKDILSTTRFQKKQVTIQLLDGLKYLHGQATPIVHRDVKPENVLVQRWGPDEFHVKLADFGLSKQSDALKTFCGTALYIAPEVLCTQTPLSKNYTKYDSMVDVWSLGLLLVKLVCGQLPRFLQAYVTAGMTWAAAVRVKSSSGNVKDSDKNSYKDSDKESDKDSDKKSNPATPKAWPASFTTASEDSRASEASTIRLSPGNSEEGSQNWELSDSGFSVSGSVSLIRDLGENGSAFIDTLLGIEPLDMASSECSDAPTPDTLPHMTLVDGELWATGASTGTHDSVAASEQSRQEQLVPGPVSIGSELGRATETRVAAAARGEDDSAATSALSPSRRKRRAEGSPVRAIVKEFISSDPGIDSRALEKMFKGLNWINKHGVLVWDVHARNYRGGILVDFRKRKIS
ncbi:Uu.00g136690.m01.CDS01 [Anthostomella pinea]|uniref:Uu.00g136690.m01.CDS01 n=1 Tax=Anthostomella pinea TaxID=933095 RepID=A0AAI8YL23_9PEZI|nr:Uu.00g136690.m01.CDS01 [Anthostomella pinea]